MAVKQDTSRNRRRCLDLGCRDAGADRRFEIGTSWNQTRRYVVNNEHTYVQVQSTFLADIEAARL